MDSASDELARWIRVEKGEKDPGVCCSYYIALYEALLKVRHLKLFQNLKKEKRRTGLACKGICPKGEKDGKSVQIMLPRIVRM